MIKFCKKCLLPNTKPHIVFKKGVCLACIFHQKKRVLKKGINWKKRKKEFDIILKKIQNKKNVGYDALVPVSGGKDSITQVSKLLGKKLKILAVHVDYGIKTDIGTYNLNRIPEMGVDLVIIKPELKIHKFLIKKGFLDYGDPDLMSHCMLHAFPLRVAYNFKIPFVLLGENSSEEYSGNENTSNSMTLKWFSEYAESGGVKVNFVRKKYKLSKKDMLNYNIISKPQLKKIKTLFCSYYFKWDSRVNLNIAKKFGFKTLKRNGEGTYRNYVGIDEKINRVHQFFKLLKFGYGRATDHACEDIRNNYISRNQGIKLVRKFDRQFISDDIVKDFIKYIGISRKEFDKTINKFVNKNIWSIDKKKLIPKFKIY